MKEERFQEIIRFVIAGAAGFVVELAALILLKERLGLDTLIATPIAFVLFRKSHSKSRGCTEF